MAGLTLVFAMGIALVLRRSALRALRRLEASWLAACYVCLPVGGILLLGVSSPWSGALLDWYTAQGNLQAAHGCPLGPLDAVYKAAEMMNERLSWVGSVVVGAIGLFGIAFGLTLAHERDVR